MKIISYTALLYNKHYLGYALRSIEPYVDEMWILYAAAGGSHGARTSLPCPDTRYALYAIAKQVAGDKLRWVDGQWSQEWQQRGAIHEYVPDADIVIVVDSDEIYETGLLDATLPRVMEFTHRNWRIPFRHFWRSFYRCILHDPAYPARIICPKVANSEITWSVAKNDSEWLSVNHMGYAIPTELCRYKWQIHGHLGEFRRDIDWFSERWDCNAQHDTHPVGSIHWNPETVNPWDYLPEFMKSHPFAKLEVIP